MMVHTLCSFTGKVSTRGRILSGQVLKTKMMSTKVICREYFHFVKKKMLIWEETQGS